MDETEENKTPEKTEEEEQKPVEDTNETIPPQESKESKDTLPPSSKPEKKPVTQPSKKETKKQAEEEDFKYIVRIANTDINGEKTLVHGLSSVKGIGRHMAILIIDTAGLDRNQKMGHLSDSQIERIQNALENIQKNAPSWMLNHRKDFDTGEDIHLIGAEIDMRLRDEINIMKKIRSYKGIRHELGLRVRGQRTRANNRTGLALGVSKKK